MTAVAPNRTLTRLLLLITGVAVLLLGMTVVAPSAQALSPRPASSWAPWKACPNSSKDNCAMVRTIVHTNNGTVFFGGDFSQLRSPDGKRSIAINNLAAVDTSGDPVRLPAEHRFNGTIFSLVTDGTTVYAGGAFSTVDGKAAAHIARFSATTGVRLPFMSGVNGAVYALSLGGPALYVGGKFSTVQGVATGNLAALRAEGGGIYPHWVPMATLLANAPAPNDPSHNNIPIRSIAATPTRIYIAGDFDLINGVARPAVAALTTGSGELDTSFAPPVSVINNSFQGMDVVPVGGLFAQPGILLAAGGLANRAWRLNPNGSIVWAVASSGDMQAAAIIGATVYFGGHFTCIAPGSSSCMTGGAAGSVSRMHIAAFPYNGSGNLAPLAGWTPELGPDHAPYYYGVWTLQAFSGQLWAGGVWRTITTNGVAYNQPKLVHFTLFGG
jgi:hypothetical protein